MGIPTFFKQIVEKYPTTHCTKLPEANDHFFIDFNSIIYDAYYGLDVKKLGKKTNTQFETILIKKVVDTVATMATEVVKPRKLLYIAMDGPAPRAKMVQQRWRRFKGEKDRIYFSRLKEKYGEPKAPIDWQPSANISPGTKFMKKMSVALQKAITAGIFEKHMPKTEKLKIILSDSNVAGEGEHKFMPMIRKMKNSHDSVCIYSPDADLFVLSMATHKDNIYILRKVKTGDDATDVEKDYSLKGHEYMFVSIDKYRHAYVEQLELDDFATKKDPQRLITDYVFLTFFSGNDFVLPMPYLKVKEKRGGLDVLVAFYKELLPKQQDYLVIIHHSNKMGDTYSINQQFLKQLVEKLVASEDYYMRGIQMKIDKTREGEGVERKMESEEGKSLYEIERIRYEHYEYYSKMHPEYKKYAPIYEKVRFDKPKHVWKEAYYNHFFGISMKDVAEYNSYRTKVSINYLESLLFTLKYYFEGVPSWNWFYRFRAPPVLSDVSINLGRMNINHIVFKLGEPYKPFDQLMMILPPQLKEFLPKKYGSLMDYDLLPYYPIDFELDVLLGGKHIYSEPILPMVDDDEVLRYTKIAEKSLTAEEKSRNKLVKDPYVKN